MKTWKDKYNKKYGYDKGTSHSLKEISKDTGVSLKGIQQIYNKGIGAFKTNPQSVRPNVKSAEQWAYGRVYSSVMGGNASKIDKNELKMEKGGKIYNAHILTADNKMIHRRYPKKITHNEIYKEYKDKGVEVKDSQIHFAKPIDFFDTLRKETKKYVRKNMNDDVDSKSIFISSIQKGNEYIATEIKGDTISGKAFTITPKDLFEITMKKNTKRNYEKGGKMTDKQLIKKEFDRLGLKEKTDYVDVETEKRGNFRLYRTRVLDDYKYPKSKYYRDDKGDVYVIENNQLYKSEYDDNMNEILTSFFMSKTKLNYGKYEKGGSTYAKGGEIYKATDVYQAPFNGKNYNMPYFIVNNEGYFLKEKYHRLNGNDFAPNTLFAISFLDKEDALSYMKKYNSELDKGGSTYAEGGEIFNDYFDIDKVKSIENVEVFTNQRKGHKNYVRVDYVPLSRPQTMQVEFRKIPFNTDEELNYIKKTLQDNFASTYAEGGEIKWKSISTITFSTKKEALKRLGLMKDSDDYRNLKVVKTTNGYDVSGEQKMARGGSTYAKGGKLKNGDVVIVKPPNWGYDSTYYVVSDKAGYDEDGFLISETSKRSSDVFEEEQLEKIYEKGGSTYAKGGSLEAHALAIGDEILGFNMGEAYVINKGVVYMVDLAKGKRKITKMTREDAISTFAKGGMTNNFDSDFMDLVKG